MPIAIPFFPGGVSGGGGSGTILPGDTISIPSFYDPENPGVFAHDDTGIRIRTNNTRDIIRAVNASTSGARFIGYRARGSATAPTQVKLNDAIALFGGKGFASSSYAGDPGGDLELGDPSGYIGFYAGEDFLEGGRGTQAVIALCESGTKTPRAVMSFDMDGEIHAWYNFFAKDLFAVNAGTTASGANTFMNNANSNLLQRVTSSAKYKDDLRPLAKKHFTGFFKLEPMVYKSIAPADDPKTDFLGLTAESVHKAGLREAVGYDADGKPEWVMYDRLIVPTIAVVHDHETRLAALENAAAKKG